jgi:AcrR family transcriptional regulator
MTTHPEEGPHETTGAIDGGGDGGARRCRSRSTSAPFDEIARRAEVGNATLYRHFPDRDALLCEVVLGVMARTADEAERAESQEPDPFAALCRFVHAAADEKVAALCSLLAADLKASQSQLTSERARLVVAMEKLMERALAAGRVRSDVSLADVLGALAQLTRPMPGAGWTNVDKFGHRNLQIYLDGIETPARSALPGAPATGESPRPLTSWRSSGATAWLGAGRGGGLRSQTRYR